MTDRQTTIATEIKCAGLTFPYEYVSGGYFRQKGVPKGEKADMLHGNEVIRELVMHIIKELERKTDR